MALISQWTSGSWQAILVRLSPRLHTPPQEEAQLFVLAVPSIIWLLSASLLSAEFQVALHLYLPTLLPQGCCEVRKRGCSRFWGMG